MILPRPFLFMLGATAFAAWNGPRTFTRMTRSHSSLGICANGFMASAAKTAALLTSTSIGPKADSVSLTIASSESSDVTSVLMPIASPPSALIAATASAVSSISVTTTLAPLAANASA